MITALIADIYITLVAAKRDKWLEFVCILGKSSVHTFIFQLLYLYILCLFILLWHFLYAIYNKYNKSVVLYCQVADNFSCCRVCICNLFSVCTNHSWLCSTQYLLISPTIWADSWQDNWGGVLQSLVSSQAWQKSVIDKVLHFHFALHSLLVGEEPTLRRLFWC